MQRSKHKRKTNHVVIVTSDAADANVKQFRIKPWILHTIIVVLCVIIGALIGYLAYERKIWDAVSQRSFEQQAVMERLEDEKAAAEEENVRLEEEVARLNEKVKILSDTVNQKVQSETELMTQLENQSMPTEFPLTGSASMEEQTEGNPVCVFEASVGTTVVATASGTVTAVNDDEEYGHNVWVDHGNGYMTVYRNAGEPTVKQGDAVVQGSTLFLIGEENNKLGYQMLHDGAYINPLDILAISG